MAGWKEILIDVIKLTDEVKRLNEKSELLSERTIFYAANLRCASTISRGTSILLSLVRPISQGSSTGPASRISV